MATGFFALLDDIAILGDDLAVNVQKTMGFKLDRELAVITLLAVMLVQNLLKKESL